MRQEKSDKKKHKKEAKRCLKIQKKGERDWLWKSNKERQKIGQKSDKKTTKAATKKSTKKCDAKKKVWKNFDVSLRLISEVIWKISVIPFVLFSKHSLKKSSGPLLLCFWSTYSERISGSIFIWFYANTNKFIA